MTIHPIHDHFLKSLNIFKKHTFNLIHQAKAYENAKKNLEEGEIIFQLDFLQNYVDTFRSLKIPNFSACTGLKYVYDKDKGQVKAKNCTLSDNLDHNAFAVWAHLKPILEETSLAYPNTLTIYFF